MTKSYIDSKDTTLFEKAVAAELFQERRTFEECRFRQCSFAGGKIDGMVFRSCIFEECDLTLATFRDTSLQEVRFIRCKLVGVQFDACRKLLLQVAFEKCLSRLSGYAGMQLKNTVFDGSDLQEADFTGADLSGSSFAGCDLTRALFNRTNLEGADFRSAFGYAFAPESNRLKRAKFSMPEVLGLLDGHGIEIE